MKIVFMGTPDFAVDTLKACIGRHQVVGVFTQPDKPKGRGNKLTPPPIKVLAEHYQIPVYQPTKVKTAEWVNQIRLLDPDVIVVVAYGQLLSQEILDIPKFGCVNVHASLLPKLRGAAPINWAIAEGYEKSGITTMLMNAGLDTGDMLLKKEIVISEDMTAESLHDALAQMGPMLLIETLSRLEAGAITPEKQDDSEATYAPLMSKETSKIDWCQTSETILNRIRGFNPWPVAHTQMLGQSLKVFKAQVADEQIEGSISVTPGTVVDVDKIGIYVRTGSGVLRIDEVQWGSSKRMMTSAFLLGKTIEIGTVLS